MSARDAGVSDRVRFLGAVGLQNLLEIYRLADRFVMPSTLEGFGVTFLEAMESGTPALGFASPVTWTCLPTASWGRRTSEADLPAIIARLLDDTKPDSFKLAAAVHACFGREKFRQRPVRALNQLMEPDSDNPLAIFSESLVPNADHS